MTRYALMLPDAAFDGDTITKGVVQNIEELPEGVELQDARNPEVAQRMVKLPDGDTTTTDGWLYDGTTFTAPPVVEHTPEQVKELKAGLNAYIDGRAEELRQQIITPGSGQAMEYQEAQAEATRALNALAQDAEATLSDTDYPMLAASVGYDVDPSTGKLSTDIGGEARSVDAARRAWLSIGSAIRRARLDGKAAVDAAQTWDAAQAACDAIAWPDLSKLGK